MKKTIKDIDPNILKSFASQLTGNLVFSIRFKL